MVRVDALGWWNYGYILSLFCRSIMLLISVKSSDSYTHPPPCSTQVSLKNTGFRIRDSRIYNVSATENGKAGRWKPPAHLSNTDLVPMPGEGNGSPLQYSCLENPMDGGAW